jgi:O-antigen ligase
VSQTGMLLVMLLLLVPLWVRLHKDFVGGLSYAVVVLIACTPLLRIQTPGVLPELTIHRLILISILGFWLAGGGFRRPLGGVPLRQHILVWALATFISLLGSSDFVFGVKRYLDFVLELFLFYFLVATKLRDREDAIRVLKAAVIGLAIVALLAFIERYRGFNVADWLVGFDEESSLRRDVRVTYRHRILLGTAMAMGWVLVLGLTRISGTALRRRWWLWPSLAAMLGACYFGMSRGPWLAVILSGGVLAVFGSNGMRKRLVLLGLLGVLLFAARPGVFGTLSGYAEMTVDIDSHKGGTFQYRLELWRVAVREIAGSPWRILFGHGPGAGAGQSIDWSLSYRDRDHAIESWDNDFAYALFQYGFVGLFATLVLYAAIPWRLLLHARRLQGAERDLFVCLGATALALFFMMSNVMIFARQLYYLLWLVTAAGFVIMSEPARSTKRLADSAAEPEPKAPPWPDLAGSLLQSGDKRFTS